MHFFLLYKEYEIPRLSKHFLFFGNTVGQKILKSPGRKKRQLGKSNKYSNKVSQFHKVFKIFLAYRAKEEH